MKTVLFVAAGIEAIQGLQRAKQLGLHVVASDANPNAPGFQYSDDHFIASTYDPTATLIAAKKYIANGNRIDGVLSIGADVPLTVATVAKGLGLPGLSLEAAHLATDKLAMKERLWACGVPVPWFSKVDDADHLKALILEHGGVHVLKPVDSRGSRGVVRVDPQTDFNWAFNQAYEISPSHRVMIEAYLDGPQLSTESLILENQYITPGLSDRNYEWLDRFAPYFIENGGDLPSQLPLEAISATEKLIDQAARALDMVHGTVKGDIVISNGVPHVIELAPRLSGGYFCSLEIPLCTGVDFVGIAIRLALGERIDAADGRPKWQKPIVQRYLFPPPGEIVSIDGVEDARSSRGVEHLIISGQPGQKVVQVSDTTTRIAMVLASGETLAEARGNADKSLQKIRLQMKPLDASQGMVSAGG